MGDDPSFDAFLAFLHDDNATGKAEVTALPITTRQNNDHPSERLPSLHHSTVKKNQSIHRVSSHPAPPHPHMSSSSANGVGKMDRPSIINRRQSTRSSNGEKTTIAHNNTTTIIDATTGARVLQKGGGGGGGGETINNPTMQNGRLVDTSNSPNSTKHNNKIIVSHNRGGSSPRRSFNAPVIIELDDKWSEHHNVLQGLQQSGSSKNKIQGVKNSKRGGGILSRFDRMFHPPVTSTSKILENYNINIKDDEEIQSIGISSISSNGSKRSLHSTLLDPFFAKIASSKRNMEACNPTESMPFSSFHHQQCSTNDEEYSLQYSVLPLLEDTSSVSIVEKAAPPEYSVRESTTKEDNNIRDDDLIELFLRGGNEKVDSAQQLHNSFDDTVVIRGGGGERTRFDEENDRRRRKPKRSDGREHQLIFI